VCNARHDPSRRSPKAAKLPVAVSVRPSKPFSWAVGIQYARRGRAIGTAVPAMLRVAVADLLEMIALFSNILKYCWVVYRLFPALSLDKRRDIWLIPRIAADD
jgi:hypothetical protein